MQASRTQSHPSVLYIATAGCVISSRGLYCGVWSLDHTKHEHHIDMPAEASTSYQGVVAEGDARVHAGHNIYGNVTNSRF